MSPLWSLLDSLWGLFVEPICPSCLLCVPKNFKSEHSASFSTLKCPSSCGHLLGKKLQASCFIIDPFATSLPRVFLKRGYPRIHPRIDLAWLAWLGLACLAWPGLFLASSAAAAPSATTTTKGARSAPAPPKDVLVIVVHLVDAEQAADDAATMAADDPGGKTADPAAD